MLTKTEFINKITRTANKASFVLKKHSPEILVISGVVGAVGSAIMACRATTKINEITDDTHDQIDRIHDAVKKIENGETLMCKDGTEYTLDQSKKDLTIVYAQTALKFAKLYGPSVVMGALSITAILAGHNITKKRNVALAAAYATVDKSFKEYRSRVVDRFGEELDKELRYNIKSEEIEEITKNEDGTETVTKNAVAIADPNLNSDYARFFNKDCSGWTPDPEYNLMFLKDQQRYANDRLKARGYLYLNEVYELLGIPHTKAGQIVGWIYDKDNTVGDNYVDFGIYDCNRKANVSDFVNGYSQEILLDFNVDGNILELME